MLLTLVALCGSGHVLFTTLLGVLVVWLGIETSKWTGNVFPWIAGGALILFGLYYLVRQARGSGHGHSHGGHDHASEAKWIDTGLGVLVLEVFEDGVPPRFQVRTEGAPATLPPAAALSLETLRPEGARQTFTFTAREGYLESLEEIPEPHEFTASLGLFTLLTFSPCEGFLPVYLSGIKYGWTGFVVLSAVLALATIAGMVIFTWLTMSGMERLRLGFLERYESGILGTIILFLGVGIISLGF